MEYKVTVEFVIESQRDLFYLECLLKYLKTPNNFLKIKDYEIVDSKQQNLYKG